MASSLKGSPALTIYLGRCAGTHVRAVQRSFHSAFSLPLFLQSGDRHSFSTRSFNLPLPVLYLQWLQVSFSLFHNHQHPKP